MRAIIDHGRRRSLRNYRLRVEVSALGLFLRRSWCGRIAVNTLRSLFDCDYYCKSCPSAGKGTALSFSAAS